MSRTVIRLGAIASLLGACAWAWWWWFTAPPRTQLADLAALAAVAQPDADGILVIGDPVRSARWLARHPQALLPLALAAPEIVPALDRLAPAARVLSTRARTGVVLWWRERDVALAARVDEGIVASLIPLATTGNLHVSHERSGEGERLFLIATGRGLFDARGGAPGTLDTTGQAMALCRIGTRWWRAVATRKRLECTTGEALSLPQMGQRSFAAFSDVRRHVPALASLASERPLELAVTGNLEGWALALPNTVLSDEVARFLGAAGDPAGVRTREARRWRGILGETWVDTRRGTALGSSPALIAAATATLGRDAGAVRGADIAWLAGQAAARLGRVPGLRSEAAALHAVSRSVSGLGGARWLVESAGGHVLLEW